MRFRHEGPKDLWLSVGDVWNMRCFYESVNFLASKAQQASVLRVLVP